jgi:hypothetical protein
MITVIIKVALLAVIGLFIFNGSDFHICTDGDHHDPVCDDCSCIICSSSLTGIDILIEDFCVKYTLSENLALSEHSLKIDEIIFELDQPPKA